MPRLFEGAGESGLKENPHACSSLAVLGHKAGLGVLVVAAGNLPWPACELYQSLWFFLRLMPGLRHVAGGPQPCPRYPGLGQTGQSHLLLGSPKLGIHRIIWTACATHWEFKSCCSKNHSPLLETALSRSDSHSIRCTHFKCPIRSFSVYS